MDKILASGIKAGMAGMPILIVSIAIDLYGGHGNNDTWLYSLFAVLSIFLLSFMVAGVLWGILAFSELKSARESFLPGLIAGFTIIAVPLLFVLIAIFVQVLSWLSSGASGSLIWLLSGILPWIFLLILPIGVASLCSALTTLFMFFRKEFNPAGATAGEEADLGSLDTLYDDLWKDARTMITDMNRSIAVYWIAGLFIFVSGIVTMAYALTGWQHISGQVTGFYDFYLILAATICSLAQLAIGPFLLYWYSKLRMRYLRLAQMEKKTGV